MRNIDNPFLISGYESPDYFCDRVAETEKLMDALKNGRNVTLLAPRRMGKTGLIKNAFHLLAAKEAARAQDLALERERAEQERLRLEREQVETAGLMSSLAEAVNNAHLERGRNLVAELSDEDTIDGWFPEDPLLGPVKPAQKQGENHWWGLGVL